MYKQFFFFLVKYIDVGEQKSGLFNGAHPHPYGCLPLPVIDRRGIVMERSMSELKCVQESKKNHMIISTPDLNS